MAEFECITCNYKTNLKANLDRHNNTSKHKKKKASDHIIISQNEHSSACDNCCKNKKIEHELSILELKLKFAEKEINRLHDEIKKKDEIIKEKENEMKNNNKYLVEENEYKKLILEKLSFKSDTSTIKYLNHHYKNAPILETIKDITKLINSDDKKLCEKVLYAFEHQTLDKFIGDIIIEEYRKEDPSMISFWNGDKNRLHCFIREEVSGKIIWTVDNNGTKVKSIVIQPFIEFIKNKINIYNGQCYKEKDLLDDELIKYSKNDQATRDKNIDNIQSTKSKRDKLIDINRICSELLMTNGIKDIEHKVLKYIAPYFHIDKA